MNLCQIYRHQLARLYGKPCAEASVVKQTNDHYLISVAISKGNEFTLLASVPHTENELTAMIAELSHRKSNP